MVLREAHPELDRIQPRTARHKGEPEEGGAPSPFIAGTKIQYAWDATSLEGLKKCPRYYQYAIVENWQGKTDSIHLRWGLEFHSALEDYEHAKAANYKHDDALHFAVRALLQRINGWEPLPHKGVRSEELKTKENLVRSVVWYLDYYEHDKAETVILANGKPAVELNFAFELPFKANDTQNYVLCGYLDKIVEYSGELYTMDHKTTTNTPGANFFNGFDPHTQMTVYTIAGQVIMQAPIKGVIVDAIQVAVEFSRPVRGFTFRSNQRLDEWMDDTRIWLEQAKVYAEQNYWPQNDTACSMYGGCRFREVCSKAPSVRRAFLETKFTQGNPRWNPLKPR